MGIYSRHILPRMLDKACGMSPITKQRAKIVPQSFGTVLEIGFGSGLNLAHLSPARVTKVLAVEPDEHIWKRSQSRRAASPVPVERIGLSGEDIPAASNSADMALVTYSLCTIPDPVQALREMRRVVKDGGPILFCEHGKAPDENVQRWQSRIDPVWKRIAGGCHSGRDIPDLIKQAGLEVTEIDTMYVPGPKALGFNYWGTAV